MTIRNVERLDKVLAKGDTFVAHLIGGIAFGGGIGALIGGAGVGIGALVGGALGVLAPRVLARTFDKEKKK